MLQLAVKALLSGVIIAIVSEVAKRQPAFGALIASLPLISVMGMVWLWVAKPDAANMAAHAQATFWYVLPSLPMFLVMPIMLITTIVSIIGTFSDVQVVYALTGGGPNNTTHVLATLSYKVGLNNGQLGQGAAIALHMLPFMLGLVFIEVWNMRRNAN